MTAWGMLVGLGAGAKLAWLFDADAGRRRRVLLRDKALRAAKVAQRGLSAGYEDLRHVSAGRLAELRSRDRSPPSDLVVEERVRACLGRHVANAHAVAVSVTDGVAHLSGPVLASERDKLVCAVGRVRGVKEVEDHLEAHPTAERVPALQGEVPPRGVGWRPATRLVAGTAGGLALLAGLRGGATRVGLVAGPLLLARALRNQPLSTLAGAGERPLVVVQRTVEVDAPLGRVRAFWEHLDNLPLFMAHIEDVRALGGERAEVRLRGPAGLGGRAVVERFASEHGFGWRSVEGLRHELQVRFEAIGHKTRCHLRFEYLPPGGLLGHGVARLFGTDPRSALDRDLLRLKSLLEVGHTTIRGETVIAGV